MSGFKKLIIFIMTIFVLFCIYWAVGRNAIIKTVTTQINAHQAEGYKVLHKGLSIGGFPFKFRVRLTEPDIASPRALEKPWSIKADDLRMEAISVNPFKWSALHRGEARIDMRGSKGERWLFDARPLNIDMTAHAGLKGNLKTIDIVATRLNAQAVIGTLPPIVAIDEARLNIAPQGADMRYDISIENIFLEKEALKGFQKAFGPRIENLSGHALAIGLKALDDAAITAWKKTGFIKGEDWELSWGGTLFQGGFDLTATDNGLTGTVRIEVDDIHALITQLEDASIFTRNQARNAKLASVLLPVNQNGRQEITLILRDSYLTLFGTKIIEL